MLADLKAAWHLRGPSIGPRRLVYVAVLILLAGLSDGVGLVLLVPLLSSLGAPMPVMTGAAAWLFALLPGTLAGLLLLFVGVAVLRAVVARLQSNAIARLRFDYAIDLKTRTYAAIANASWSYLRRKRTADFHALFASEIDRIEHSVQLLLEVPARFVIFLAHIAIGVAIAPAFSALAIALGLCLMWGLRRRLTESRRLGDIVSEASLRVNREITEFLQALKLTKAYGAEAQHVRAFSDAVQQAEGASLVSRRLLANTELILEIATAVVLAALLWLAAGWLELPLASLLVLILVFQRIMPKFQEIQGMAQEFVHSSSAFRIVAATIADCDAAADRTGQAPQGAVPFDRELRLEGVDFGYDAAAGDVLSGIDLALPAGSLTVLSGVSGAGKSTLLDLVGGLIVPATGRILVDGVELTAALAPAWRRSVGYMAQEAFLFHDSIRANLAWADPTASDERMLDVLQQAGLTELLRDLPRGLDTVVGDRGTSLSGGERQRLALARTLLRAPRLILLDEPASALDARNEERLLDTIAGLCGQTTIMLVTHRPAAIAGADRYLTLVDGKLVTASPSAPESKSPLAS
ncbi:MAG: ABC transporter ATP-binding protein [Reyranella sp.]|nr:ABC transporter ATP-binding protein [Reyranella sp.]MDP3161639.1 ABC transporter ATP-binding protein [Reyranella sp.]